MADRLIKGQVINAQQQESIDVLKNENQKLKDKIKEMEIEYTNSNELRQKELDEKNINKNEKEMLHVKVSMLLEENSKLRDTPDVQRLEEELVQVKMREAEAQLAIKELQKTIHVLNLEYQEFLNNRTAVISTLNSSSSTENKSISGNETQALEEEILKVKMREAETQSEMKSVNLKLMQLDTEKQVAYNQIKRQDEEIRKLNSQITQMCEKEQESRSQLMEYRRQLDDKEALLKESMMTHKIQEIEDASVIAELKQRVASLEVQIQEFLTTGQLNDTGKSLNLYNGMSGSIDKLIDINDDLKNLMSSQTSLWSDKISLIRSNSLKPDSDLVNPVNKSLNGTIKNGNGGSLNSLNDSKKVSFSQNEEYKKKKLSEPDIKTNMNIILDSVPNHVIAEYLDSDEDNIDELDKSDQLYVNDKSNSSENVSIDKSNSSNEFKTADVDLALRPPVIENLGTVFNSDFVKTSIDDESEN